MKHMQQQFSTLIRALTAKHLHQRLRTRIASTWESVCHHLPPLDFITLHYAYFLGVIILSSIVFYVSSTPAGSVTFTDSLFLTVSAMTLAGLNTINLSQLNTFQQVLLFLLIMLGSAILVSSAVVHVRRKAFERRFKHIIEVGRHERRARRISELSQSHPLRHFNPPTGSEMYRNDDGVLDNRRTYSSPRSEGRGVRAVDHIIPRLPFQLVQENKHVGSASLPNVESTQDLETGVWENKDEDGASSPEVSYASSFLRFVPHRSSSGSRSHRQPYPLPVGEVISSNTHLPETDGSGPPYKKSPVRAEYEMGKSEQGTQKYFKSGGTIGRNSQFHSLTAAERERLGGVEYRAITLLEIVVPLYFILWQLFGCIGLGAWIALNAADTTLQNGLNPWYDSIPPASQNLIASQVGWSL